MSEPESTVRRIPLTELAEFTRHLLAALGGQGFSGERLASLVGAAVRAQCEQCGLQLTAEELIGLGSPTTATGEPLAKLLRVSLGYCARNGCPSSYYQLTLLPHAEVMWEEVLAEAATRGRKRHAAALAEAAQAKQAKRAGQPATLLKVLAGAAFVLILLLLRQSMLGGRIPLLREPATFTIDPSSPGAAGCCPEGTNCPIHGPLLRLRAARGTNAPAGEEFEEVPPLEILLPGGGPMEQGETNAASPQHK